MRWARRNGWRIAFLAASLWIAIELHRLVDAVDFIDSGGVSLSLDIIADKLDTIAQQMK